jgi:hypothetical protein
MGWPLGREAFSEVETGSPPHGLPHDRFDLASATSTHRRRAPSPRVAETAESRHGDLSSGSDSRCRVRVVRHGSPYVWTDWMLDPTE